MTSSNTAESESTEASQPIRREIPPLGRNGFKKLNMKVLMFVLSCGLLLFIMFFYMYSKLSLGSSAKPAVVAKEAQIVVPERKRVGPASSLPDVSLTTAFPGLSSNPFGSTTSPFGTNTLPIGSAPPGGISESLSIALKRALQGGSVFNGDAPVSIPGAGGQGVDSTLSLEEKANRDAAAIIRRRTVDSGSVTDFLGGTPRVQPQTSSQTQSSSGLNSALSGIPGLGGFGAAASLPGAGSGGAASSGGASQLAGLLQGAQQSQAQVGNGASGVEATSFPVTTAREIPLAADTYIAQGTSIKCVMDSRLISDIPGQAMCNVAEPIYGFSAKKVLIPKGSRLIGQYKRGADDGFDRVAIIWNRVITPSGLDIAMSNPGTDMLGGTGVPGYVDSHWGERLGAALLISMGADIFKYAAITNGPKVKKTIVSPLTGITTVVEEPFDSETVKTLSTAPQQILAKSLARLPTVIINQGTLINVVTNRDLDFSTVY